MPNNQPILREKDLEKHIKHKRKKGYSIFGITGHRDLIFSDYELIKAKITEKLEALKEQSDKAILLTSLAPGADQMFSECFKSVFENDGELFVLKVLPEKDYLEESFNGYTNYQLSEDTELDKNEVYITSTSSSNNYRKYTNTNLPVDAFETYIETTNNKNHKSFHLYNENDRKERIDSFAYLGKLLIKHSDILFALWDGTYGSGKGGTGDVVRKWSQHQTQHNRTLHQLSVSRKSNPFPIIRTFRASEKDQKFDELSSFSHNMKWKSTPFIKKSSSILNTYAKIPNFFWFLLLAIITHSLLIRLTFSFDSFLSFGALLLLVLIITILHIKYKNSKSLIQRFVVPILLGVFTISLGSYGFNTYDTDISKDKTVISNQDNNLFKAIGFISMSSSDFSKLDNDTINNAMLTARSLGAVTAIYAFLLAFMLASGKENSHKLKFFFFRIRNVLFGIFNMSLSIPYKVIIGNGDRPLLLALNMEEQNNSKIIVLSETITYDQIKDSNIWLFKGDITAVKNLEKTYYKKASDVFIVSDNDTENFRIAEVTHRIDESDPTSDHFANSNWFIHQNSIRDRELLPKLNMDNCTVFSFNENIIRRLLAKYPIDRFIPNIKYNKNGSSTMAILGFNDIAQEIILHAARIGHFEQDKSLSIEIYYKTDEQKEVDRFKAKYPSLFKYDSSISEADIQSYAFPNIDSDFIVFKELPQSETRLCDKNWDLYNTIASDKIITIFTCLSNGTENTSVLASILPQLKFKKEKDHCDIQVFCQYDSRNIDEMESVEYRINALAPNIPIIYFSNQAQECSEENIKTKAQDSLAKRIAVLYDYLDKYDVQHSIAKAIKYLAKNDKDQSELDLISKEEQQNVWNQLSQNHRASNRYAADHALIKSRIRHNDGSALDRFYELVDDIWGNNQHGVPEKALSKEFFRIIKQNKIPNLSEIEHRRWVACNLIDGFSLLDDPQLWSTHKTQLKEQKIHRDLIPFKDLDDESKAKDITGVCGVK